MIRCVCRNKYGAVAIHRKSPLGLPRLLVKLSIRYRCPCQDARYLPFAALRENASLMLHRRDGQEEGKMPRGRTWQYREGYGRALASKRE
jgi:hypothetical protein